MPHGVILSATITMRKFYCNDNGFIEHKDWSPFCWVNVECPDKDDVSFMLDDLDIPSDFLDSVADIDERSRVERDGDWKLTILRIPIRTNDDSMPFTTVPIGIITNNEILLTVCYHHTELIPDFVDHTRSKGIKIDNEADFILRILYSSAFWYLRYLKDISHMVDAASDQLEKSIRNEDLLILKGLQSTMVYFNTSIRGNEILIDRLHRIYGDHIDEDLLEDVQIELHQADSTANIYSDILESTMSSFAGIISNNVNDIMKKMTAISIVLMIPTLVASFYGMNVQITYGNHPWVFWCIVGGSFILSTGLFFILRKFHWL